MTLRYMLDTDVCIFAMRERPAAVRERVRSAADQLCISSVTLAELLYGAEKSAQRLRNLEIVESFAARLEILPFADKAAAHYGQIRAQLERMGQRAGAYDMMIGGHARSEALIVVTNNLREFERMQGVASESWL